MKKQPCHTIALAALAVMLMPAAAMADHHAAKTVTTETTRTVKGAVPACPSPLSYCIVADSCMHKTECADIKSRRVVYEETTETTTYVREPLKYIPVQQRTNN